MSAAFVPKRYLVAPDYFGLSSKASWKPWSPAEEHKVARSWLQHRFAEMINLAIAEETGGPEEFAQMVGGSSRTIHDKLVGRTPIGIDDLVTWPMVLGAGKYPRIETLTDFLPPAELVRSDYKDNVVSITRPSGSTA